MRIFKIKSVARFTKREGISDASLADAVERAGSCLVDADLGGGLIRQRVARAGQGTRGGFRMLIGIRAKDRAICLYGFAKSDMENIDKRQLATLREVAAIWLACGEEKITLSVEAGLLIEV